MGMRNDNLWHILLGMWWGLVACALICLAGGCASKRVPVTGGVSARADTAYVTKVVRDTFRVRDSAVVRVEAVGDTVYKTKEVWRWRDRLVHLTDTVYRSAVRADTIRVPVPAERKLSWWERTVEQPLRTAATAAAVAVCLLFAAWLGRRLAEWSLRCNGSTDE